MSRAIETEPQSTWYATEEATVIGEAFRSADDRGEFADMLSESCAPEEAVILFDLCDRMWHEGYLEGVAETKD